MVNGKVYDLMFVNFSDQMSIFAYDKALERACDRCNIKIYALCVVIST
jgi:hypothetical protein